MIVASPDKRFKVYNGPELSSLQDLLNALIGMNNQQYIYHVYKDKNDFASWVEVVLQEPECAAVLRKARTRSGAIPVVRKYINKYEK